LKNVDVGERCVDVVLSDAEREVWGSGKEKVKQDLG
jgi:hypothetical protein